MNVVVVRDGQLVLSERVKPLPARWNVARMHRCCKCGAPHRRRVVKAYPDLCSGCAKGESQARYRERLAAARVEEVC